MDPKDLITAEEAAEIFSITVNAFRILAYRRKREIKVKKVGRKVFYSRTSLMSLFRDDS